MEEECDMKLTFTAEAKPTCERTFAQPHPFSCKIELFFYIPLVSLLYLILIKVDSPRRAHLSLVIGSSQHKDSSVCLDENVDGRRCDAGRGDAQTDGRRP